MLDQALDRSTVDEAVVAILEVAIDVPEDGTRDMTLAVCLRAHVDFDYAQPGIVKVFLKPFGADQDIFPRVVLVLHVLSYPPT
jgi:hypothetical protein